MNPRIVIAAVVVSLVSVSGVGYLVFKQVIEKGGSTVEDRAGGKVATARRRYEGIRRRGSRLGDGGSQRGSSRSLANSEVEDGQDGARSGAKGKGSRGPRASMGAGDSEGDEGRSTSKSSSSHSSSGTYGSASLFAFVEDGDHAPVSGVAVVLRNSRQKFTERTDGQGLATFDGLPPASYEVIVQQPRSTPLRASRSVSLSQGSQQEVRFVLVPFDAEITGRVLDSDGNPVEGIVLSVSSFGREEGSNPLVSVNAASQIVTNAEGRFEILELASGEHLLRTKATSKYPSVRRNVIAPSEGVDIVLYEEENVLIFGTISDPSGLAIPEVGVSSVSGGERTTSAWDGSFQLEIVLRRGPTSRILLTAQKEGYLGVEEPIGLERLHNAVTTPEGVRQLEVDLELEPLGEFGAVTGRVIDTHGELVSGQTVYLHSGTHKKRYHGISAANGEYEIQNVRTSKDYRLWVYPGSYYKDKIISPLEVGEGENYVEIVLEPVDLGTVEGVVVDASGRPVPRFTIHLRSQQSLANRITTTTDGSGRFRVEDVPTGELLIETRALPKLSVKGIRVEPNEEVRVEVPVGIGNYTIDGTLEEASGAAVPGARVIVTWSLRKGSLWSSLFNETVSDATGRFELAGFGQGEFSLTATAPGYEPKRHSFKLGAGSQFTPITLELNPTSSRN